MNNKMGVKATKTKKRFTLNSKTKREIKEK